MRVHLSHAMVHLMFGRGFLLLHRRGVEGGLDVKYLTGTSSYREVG
jgi:hypothetical protein